MKRIAAPMIGGVITSAILELLLYPTIYMLWRRRHLPEPGGPEAPAPLAGAPPETRRRRRWLAWSVLLAAALAAGGYFAWQLFIKAPEAASTALSQPPFATQAAGGLKVNFYHPQGALRFAENDVVIEFVDATSGEPVEVGTVRFDLDMNMPGMVMHSGSTVTATGEPGRYRAKVKPDMAGDWTAQPGYDGLRGQGSISFTVNVKL